MKRTPRRSGFLFVAAVLAMFGCNGIGCEGCDGDREFPSHPDNKPPTDAGAGKSDSGLSVKTGFNICPTASIQAGPLMVRVGQSLTVTGNGTDPDDPNLTYTWTSAPKASGYFGEDSERETTFTCTEPGPVAITVTVSDGSCTTPESVSVFCLAIRDAGAGGGSGGSTGSGGSGGADGGAPTVVDICPTAEPGTGGAMCASCTMDNCSLGPSPMTDGCCGLPSAADRLLCATVYNCFVAKNCSESGDPTPCYCGTSGLSCFSGLANGACKAEVEEAAKTIDPMLIDSRWVSGLFPIGRAVNLTVCRGSFCPQECGVR